MRTFVFISNIPDFLLQPIYKSEEKDGAGEAGTKKSLATSKFDLRYERLRRLLMEHSTGVMLVMHLETRGYALALYASEGEALAACKADITPEQPGHKYPPLRLRILEKEKPRPPEPVYNPYLTVEGEEVRKTDLADTRGLELVYRGRALPKWCPRTLAGEDCHFGVSCLKLHKAAVQRTVRKRPRIDEEDVEAQLSADEVRTVRRLLACVKDAREALAPPSLQMPQCLYIPVTPSEMSALCHAQTQESAAAGTAVAAALVQRVEAAVAAAAATSSTTLSSSATTNTTTAAGATSSFPRAYFPRLSCPSGAPWDWSVESCEGRRVLREVCPLPANGAPTPLERDLYLQRLWYHMNQLNKCHSAADVVKMLRCSRRVGEALRKREASERSATTHARAERSLPAAAQDDVVSDATTAPSPSSTAAATAPAALQESSKPLYLCLEPWLYLPTVGCEVTAFLERGGRRVRGVVQRYGQVRLMTSAALLSTAAMPPQVNEDSHTTAASPSTVESGLPTQQIAGDDVDALLSRYAVLESGNDPVAEDALSGELRSFQRVVATAVGDLARHLRQSSPAVTGGEKAAWCVHLAVKLPTPAEGRAAPSAVLLSCSAYHRAMEECSMYSALAPATNTTAAADSEKALQQLEKAEVTWNTQRHPYIPLFSRDTLEKLRADATD